jgi:hypothetical protein
MPVTASREREPEARKFPISPSWLAVAISLLAVFWQIAVTSVAVAENTRRVELLEAADRQRGDALSRIDARTARIEATLDIMRGGPPYRPLSEPIVPGDRVTP